jgi:hypothetical protein
MAKIVRVICPASDIPDGSRVRKIGEPQVFILGSELAGFEFGNQKRAPIRAPRGHRFLIENVDLGIGTGIPDNLDLIWFREEHIEQDLKLYTYDRGVYGMSVVVGRSQLDAALTLKDHRVRDYEAISALDMEEHEIVYGLLLDNLGDA